MRRGCLVPMVGGEGGCCSPQVGPSTAEIELGLGVLCVHVYIHMCVVACVHTCVHMCMYAYRCTCVCLYVCVHVCVHIFSYGRFQSQKERQGD